MFSFISPLILSILQELHDYISCNVCIFHTLHAYAVCICRRHRDAWLDSVIKQNKKILNHFQATHETCSCISQSRFQQWLTKFDSLFSTRVYVGVYVPARVCVSPSKSLSFGSEIRGNVRCCVCGCVRDGMCVCARVTVRERRHESEIRLWDVWCRRTASAVCLPTANPLSPSQHMASAKCVHLCLCAHVCVCV